MAEVKKEFIPYDVVRNNALKLAHRINREGFVPDVIYVSLRGGAYLGNVISEYFKFVRRSGRPIFYAAVVARSYTDIHERSKVMVDGWTYDPHYLRSGDRVLLVDDIFDSGRTVNHLVNVILEQGIPREDVRIAVHDYKIRTFSDETLPIHPDYYCRKLEVTDPEEDTWVHYLSHELVGLTENEIEVNYASDKEVVRILQEIRPEGDQTRR